MKRVLGSGGGGGGKNRRKGERLNLSHKSLRFPLNRTGKHKEPV